MVELPAETYSLGGQRIGPMIEENLLPGVQHKKQEQMNWKKAGILQMSPSSLLIII